MTANSLVRWNAVGQKAQHCFGRQALPMIWDFAETNVFGHATGSADAAVFCSHDPLQKWEPPASGVCRHGDAVSQRHSTGKIVSTDPPYYDNIGYADLSDFFYVWLRRSLRSRFPDLFTTLAVPKREELVATPYRHGSRASGMEFFLTGMGRAMRQLAEQAHPGIPVTIYYAFKQSETSDEGGTTSTGWETFLNALIRSGFSVTGTWPMRTEMATRQVGMGTNALASSVVLVCRRRGTDASVARREFVEALNRELPPAVVALQKAGIAPVDLAQAAIGPGMAVFTRSARVLYADGKAVTVREALALINRVLDETLTEQEGEFDADTRWALAWFTQHHFDEADFGIANVLAMAKNTAVPGLVEAGILRSGGGRVRLLRPEELPEDWDPATDRRLTVWEMVHHLVRVLEGDGELAAGQLLRRIGGQAEAARDLAYRLYAICDRQKRAAEARVYNSLVTSWPELARLAREDHGRQQRLQ